MTPGGTDRPDGAVLRDDATARQRIAYEKDEPGFSSAWRRKSSAPTSSSGRCRKTRATTSGS